MPLFSTNLISFQKFIKIKPNHNNILFGFIGNYRSFNVKKFSLFLAVCILLSQASTVSCLASHSKYVVKDTNADFIQPPQEVKTIKYLDFSHHNFVTYECS